MNFACLRFLLLAVVVASAALSRDDTGTVSLVGKNVDSSDRMTVGIMLVLADHTWQKFENENRSHYFNSKKGVWVKIAPNTVILRTDNNATRVGELTGIEPEKAKKGDGGRGKSDESGIAFTWSVQ